MFFKATVIYSFILKLLSFNIPTLYCSFFFFDGNKDATFKKCLETLSAGQKYFLLQKRTNDVGYLGPGFVRFLNRLGNPGTKAQTMRTKIELHEPYQMHYIFHIPKPSKVHKSPKYSGTSRKRPTFSKNPLRFPQRRDEKLKFILSDRTPQALSDDHQYSPIP